MNDNTFLDKKISFTFIHIQVNDNTYLLNRTVIVVTHDIKVMILKANNPANYTTGAIYPLCNLFI